jgi:hypothetical protein
MKFLFLFSTAYRSTRSSFNIFFPLDFFLFLFNTFIIICVARGHITVLLQYSLNLFLTSQTALRFIVLVRFCTPLRFLIFLQFFLDFFYIKPDSFLLLSSTATVFSALAVLFFQFFQVRGIALIALLTHFSLTFISPADAIRSTWSLIIIIIIIFILLLLLLL